ncbi:MAG TPA: 3-hydroxyisobutyryl-CoA hydrolase [Devosiaceae bacterium]
MSEFVETSTEGRLGIIALNRPQAINALSGEMIAAIAETLNAWRDDDAVQVVLFEGRGPRGFCAGGDVRAVRELVLAGKMDAAQSYFVHEYALNGQIARYRKPVVALTHGAVMGGGIGIAGHARFRLTTPEARFAMPEAAIGFVVDTGVNAILARAAEPRALAFLLSGLTVGAGDALALGLADCVIDAGRVEAVRTGIIAAADAADIETALVSLMQAESVEGGAPEVCEAADLRAEAFTATSVAGILAALGDDAVLGQVIAGRSPTSLDAILSSHRAARRARQVEEVLALDLRFAHYMIAQPDFVEGVRAVLVDKDQKPRWQPARGAEVDRAAIEKLINPL